MLWQGKSREKARAEALIIWRKDEPEIDVQFQKETCR